VTWKGGATPQQAEIVATAPVSQSESTSQQQTPSSAATDSALGGKNRGLLMGLLALLVFVLLVTLGLYVFLARKKPAPQPEPAPVVAESVTPPAAAPNVYRPVTRDVTTPGRDLGPEPVPFDLSQLAATPGQPEPTPAAKPARIATQIAARFSPPGAGSPTAWLQADGGPQSGRWFSIEAAEYWIGALELNNLALDDATVSGHHACIAYDSGTLTIWDHNSTNGTFINGQQVSGSRRMLRPGDRVRIGQTTFTLLRTRENA
jgi:hypothetical protein